MSGVLNLDFPIYEARLSPEIRKCGVSALTQMLGERDDEIPFFHPFTTFQLEHELYPISIPLKASYLTGLIRGPIDSLLFQPHSKLRLYFDYNDLTLRFTAMVQLDTKLGVEEIELKDTVGQQVWAELKSSVSSATRESLGRSSVAHHRAFVYAFSVAVARSAWRFIHNRLGSYLAGQNAILSAPDIRLLFGSDVAARVQSLTQSQGDASDELQSSGIGVETQHCECSGSDTLKSVTNPGLCQRLLTYEMVSGNPDSCWECDPNVTAVENLGSLLPYLRQVIDVERRETDSSVSRLQDGLTFRDICVMLSQNGAACSVAELSFAVDVLVDGGMLVPQLVFRQGDQSVIRSYRSGENEEADLTTQTKSVVHKLLVQRRKDGDPPFSEKGFSKTFAALRLLYPRLPFALRLRTYGVEPVMDDVVLREWCGERGHRILETKSSQEY